MTTSFVNNLIETTRSCTITDGKTDFCEDKKNSEKLKFGRCLICEKDNCNGVGNNSSNKLCNNIAIVLIAILFALFCY